MAMALPMIRQRHGSQLWTRTVASSHCTWGGDNVSSGLSSVEPELFARVVSRLEVVDLYGAD